MISSTNVSWLEGKRNDFLEFNSGRDTSVSSIPTAIAAGNSTKGELREYSMGMLLPSVRGRDFMHVYHTNGQLCDNPQIVKDCDHAIEFCNRQTSQKRCTCTKGATKYG